MGLCLVYKKGIALFKPKDNPTLRITEIFHSIQGEGPCTGTPAIFVRFSGCNLSCPWCDESDKEDQTQDLSTSELLKLITGIFAPSGLVVLTGGEPLIQPIVSLVRVLTELGFFVHIETNGTSWQEDLGPLLPHPRIWAPHEKINCLVCSPKTEKLDSRASYFASVYKYIISTSTPLNKSGLPKDVGQPPRSLDSTSIFLQPLDEKNEQKNKDNLSACITLCLIHGYRISLQTHKIMGIK